jgi:hypothetical protein
MKFVPYYLLPQLAIPIKIKKNSKKLSKTWGGASGPNDRDRMANRNVTESHFGQNRNETEFFWGPGMRPNYILGKSE